MRRAGLALIATAAAVLAGSVGWTACGRSSSGAEPEDGTTVVSVRIAPIVRTTLRGYVSAWGTVEPQQATTTQPPASARISTPVSGIVAQVACAEGRRAAKGAVLFRLDSRVADIAVEKARQAVRYAEQAFERQQKLGAGEATSQRLYLEAEQNVVAARSELANADMQRALLDVSSPLSGTVVRVSARPGDAVDPTSVLAEVIDLDRLVMTATVRSVDVPRIGVGQAVEVFLGSRGAAPGAASSGALQSRVVFIGPQVDAKTDTVQVRALVPRGSGLRPGQFVDLRIAAEERRDRLAVPVDAVVTDAGVSSIAIVTGETAAKRPVKTGVRDGALIEVEGDGLAPGMIVVTAGAYGLPAQSKVKVIRP